MLYIENKDQAEEVPYNFTKFLVAKDGKVVFYSPLVDPEFLTFEIEAYLDLINLADRKRINEWLLL